jgi:hypothetical protein
MKKVDFNLSVKARFYVAQEKTQVANTTLGTVVVSGLSRSRTLNEAKTAIPLIAKAKAGAAATELTDTEFDKFYQIVNQTLDTESKAGVYDMLVANGVDVDAYENPQND